MLNKIQVGDYFAWTSSQFKYNNKFREPKNKQTNK